MRITQTTVNRLSIAAIAAAAALAVGVSLATAALGGGADEITACVKANGTVRIAESGRCKGSERVVSWARRGPAGPAGPPGPTGPAGEVRAAQNPPCPVAEAPPETTLGLFASIAGIPGDSVDDRHREQIDLSGVSFDATGARAACGPSRGTRQLGNVVMAKRLDRATPLLLGALATGRVLPSVRIEGVAPAGGPGALIVYELTEVVVDAISTASRGGVPVELVSLRFASLTLTQRTPDARGGLGPAVTVTVTQP